jgi:hypothetical protein
MTTGRTFPSGRPCEDIQAAHASHLEIEHEQVRKRVFRPVCEWGLALEVTQDILAVCNHDELGGNFGLLECPPNDKTIIQVIFRQKDGFNYSALDFKRRSRGEANMSEDIQGIP